MTINSLYPGFVKFTYTGNLHSHLQVLPVKPTISGSTWALDKVLGGTYDPWTDGIDAYVVLFKACLKTTDGCARAELWTMLTSDADPEFREAYDIDVDGTNGGSVAPFSQLVINHRTDGGGLLRWYVMEGAGYTVDGRDLAPLNASTFKSVSDFLIASTGFVFGRDGTRPISAIAATTKTNDALRKKYFINS